MCDDGDKCGVIIELVGFLTIIVMDKLTKQGVFKPHSDIPNLGYILAIIVHWGYQMEHDFGIEWEHASWIYRVVEQAEEASISLSGPAGFAETLAKIKDIKNQSNRSLKKWKPVSWSTKVGCVQFPAPFNAS